MVGTRALVKVSVAPTSLNMSDRLIPSKLTDQTALHTTCIKQRDNALDHSYTMRY